MTMTMTNNRIIRIFVCALCVALAVCIGFTAPAQLFAKATEPVLYVEDIRLAVINRENETIEDAQEEVGADYIIADKVELNPGTSTGRDVYLAYNNHKQRYGNPRYQAYGDGQRLYRV